jgi:hypothetical protein
LSYPSQSSPTKVALPAEPGIVLSIKEQSH